MLSNILSNCKLAFGYLIFDDYDSFIARRICNKQDATNVGV